MRSHFNRGRIARWSTSGEGFYEIFSEFTLSSNAIFINYIPGNKKLVGNGDWNIYCWFTSKHLVSQLTWTELVYLEDMPWPELPDQSNQGYLHSDNDFEPIYIESPWHLPAMNTWVNKTNQQSIWLYLINCHLLHHIRRQCLETRLHQDLTIIVNVLYFF